MRGWYLARITRPMNGLLYVAAGGALGAMFRHILGVLSFRIFGPGVPYGTFAANVLGGFLMGLLVSFLAFKISGGENLRLFLGVGLLGGFTTFSSFSLDAMLMYQRKDFGLLSAYVVGSVVLSIFVLGLGLWVGRKVFAP